MNVDNKMAQFIMGACMLYILDGYIIWRRIDKHEILHRAQYKPLPFDIRTLTLPGGITLSSLKHTGHPSNVQLYILKVESGHMFPQTYHSNSCTHCLGGKILPELRTDNTTVTMGACHLSPDNPVSAGLLIAPLLGLLLHPVNIGHPLPQVIVCLFPVRYSVQLEE